MGLRKFCSDGYADPWQLSRRASLGLIAVVIVLVFLAILAAAHVLHLIGQSGQPSPKALARPLLGLGVILVSAFGVGSYTFVASQAVRPHILHVYGLILVLHLLHSSTRQLSLPLEYMKVYLAFSLLVPMRYMLWAVRWVLFCKVVTQKMGVLGPPACRCESLKLWGKGLAASIVLSASAGSVAWILLASNLVRGFSWEEIFEVVTSVSFSPSLADDSELSVADQIAFYGAVNLTGLGSVLVLACAAAFIFTAWRRICGVVAALEVRGAPKEMLKKVRCTLREHLLGIVLSLSTTMLLIFTTVISGLLVRDEDAELATTLANTIDSLADIAGILILSEIGTLLVHEDPKAGDVNRNIRSLLQAAVLRGRTTNAFEGQVIDTPSRRCIVSFPGKFSEEWKDMTWQSERHEASTACVFLPESDPHQRFGKHSPCPETPGSCWCVSLYGAEKPWGCSWFPVWEANVQRAVDLGLELVVVFFPGQVGQGLVAWDSLARVDLWDGRGLGGSQKGEAAYLGKQGLNFTSEDLEATRSWLLSNHRRAHFASRKKSKTSLQGDSGTTSGSK